jgi:hypothetical protein
MTEPSSPSIEARLAALERAVRDLQARVELLRQGGFPLQPEHPVDRMATRDKAVYDWQGPR